ncbi:MAG: hypothetical protein JO372_19575 [Solirubrobacterales bacterium]|nr:hypothetical protein [Solirubrobacterales bacterium]
MPPAPPAPLEASDPDCARALKAKIRDRVSDVRRHLIALRTSSPAARQDSLARRPRAPRHTVRLALIYALLDCSDVIQLEHLEAALGFWAYGAASARWVFGDSIGDPNADEIWALARDRHDGITRTEVSNLFSRNKKAREIDRALQALIDAGRLDRATIRDPRNDRAVSVWRPKPAAINIRAFRCAATYRADARRIYISPAYTDSRWTRSILTVRASTGHGRASALGVVVVPARGLAVQLRRPGSGQGRRHDRKIHQMRLM